MEKGTKVITVQDTTNSKGILVPPQYLERRRFGIEGTVLRSFKSNPNFVSKFDACIVEHEHGDAAYLITELKEI